MTGSPHCADASEGLRQGATAASAAGDGGPALRGRERSALCGVGPEKVPDETMIPTSAAGRSAADWRTCRSGDRESPGRALKKGTLVDATIISAPSSTGNESNARGLEMHRTRKGNRRHFGRLNSRIAGMS